MIKTITEAQKNAKSSNSAIREEALEFIRSYQRKRQNNILERAKEETIIEYKKSLREQVLNISNISLSKVLKLLN